MGFNDDQLERLVAQLTAANETQLARLNAHLQALIPTFVEEYDEMNAPASTTSVLIIKARRDTLFRCTGIFVSLPDGATEATIQLGDLTLPIQNTTFFLPFVQRVLSSTDARRVTFTTGDTAGVAVAWLYGDAVPSYGVL